MKVKVGTKITGLPKDVVASHMANILTTKDIALGRERDFKKVFLKYKDLCLIFLRHNKKFVLNFSDQTWMEDFRIFRTKQHELLMQEMAFSFTDGTTWTISMNDLANLRIMLEPDLKHEKLNLLGLPVELAEWAQTSLQWEQVKDFTILREVTGDEAMYAKEWKTANKKVIQYNYEIEK